MQELRKVEIEFIKSESGGESILNRHRGEVITRACLQGLGELSMEGGKYRVGPNHTRG